MWGEGENPLLERLGVNLEIIRESDMRLSRYLGEFVFEFKYGVE